ncbi:hypothetical protein PM082_023502 [Marasmius tenuissimus]|nr:hypothetical protein PM082_023502 [Marasmius tenuissimus]
MRSFPPRSATVMTEATIVPGFPTTRKSKYNREQEVLERYPIPDHWKASEPDALFGLPRRALFNVLCLASFGHAGLEPIWASIKLEEEGDGTLRDLGIRTTCERLNNLIVVGSLLLASSSVFITTPPPKANFMDYTLRGPYGCLLASFGLLIGGVIIASGCVLVVSKAQPQWSQRVLFRDRLHVYLTLLPLAYPPFSIGVATMLLAFGVLSAIWCGEDPGYQGIGGFLLIMPIFVSLIFPVSCAIAWLKGYLVKSSTSDTHESTARIGGKRAQECV